MGNSWWNVIVALFVIGCVGCSSGIKTSLGGGFDGPYLQKITTVSWVKKASVIDEGKTVLLCGHIVQYSGGDDYLFKDNSGEITLIIPSDVWAGRIVKPYQLVSIQGRIVKGFDSVKVYTTAISIN
ncbi:NirD/YgiW/YdeI family stress tolerance protein [Escherichia coli]|nr:NirD/YgiW/YdeI family stress tolerance protein [Escherichia coli]